MVADFLQGNDGYLDYIDFCFQLLHALIAVKVVLIQPMTMFC